MAAAAAASSSSAPTVIFVAPCTSQCGAAAVRHILRAYPASVKVRASTRSWKRAASLDLGAPIGGDGKDSRLQVVEGEVSADGKLDGAVAKFLAGCDALLLVPPQLDDARATVVGAYAAAAVQAGIKHLVLLSGGLAGSAPTSVHGASFLSAEQAVTKAAAGSATVATVLRCATFFENQLLGADSLKATSTLRFPSPGTAAVPHIAVSDIGEAAANLLLSAGATKASAARHGGKTYTLCGASVSWQDMSKAYSQQLGRAVTYTPVTQDAYLQHLQAQGVPAPVAKGLAECHGQWNLEPSAAATDQKVLTNLLGRPPMTFADWLARHAGAFGGGASAAATPAAGAGAAAGAAGAGAGTPVTKRDKVKEIVVDMAQWHKRRDDLHKAARDRESQWSGASLSLVHVHTLAPMQSKDRNGRSDPYFVVWLSGYPGGALRTPVQSETLTPTFDLKDGTCQFPLTNECLAQLRQGRLLVHVEVWDFDAGRTDDFMGWTNGYVHFSAQAADAQKAAAAAGAAGGALVTDLAVMDGATQYGAVRLHFKLDVGPKPPGDDKPPRATLPAATGDAKAAPATPIAPHSPTTAASLLKSPAGAAAATGAASASAAKVYPEPAFPRLKAKRDIITDEKVWRAKIRAHADMAPEAQPEPDRLAGAWVHIRRIETLSPLQAKDVGDTSDPYFVLNVADWPAGALKTSTVKGSLSPVYDLTHKPLSFPLTNTGLKHLRAGQLALHVEVWDSDVVYDDFMGYTNVNLHYTGSKDKDAAYELAVKDGANAAGAIRLVVHFQVEPETRYEGTCLCTQAKLHVLGKPLFSGFCHCTQCAKVGNTDRGLVMGYARDKLVVAPDSRAVLTAHKVGRVTRYFCAVCGTGVYNDSGTFLGTSPTLFGKAGDDTYRVDHDLLPQMHVHYGSSCLYGVVRDGSQLPLFKDFPKQIGGSGEVIRES